MIAQALDLILRILLRILWETWGKNGHDSSYDLIGKEYEIWHERWEDDKRDAERMFK